MRYRAFLQCRHREPAKLGKQPNSWLLDKLVFGAGVGHGAGGFYSNKNSFCSNVLSDTTFSDSMKQAFMASLARRVASAVGGMPR